VYYNCVKFHKNPISGLGGVALTSYIDEFKRNIKNSFTNWYSDELTK
jgi:hypothetical protein